MLVSLASRILPVTGNRKNTAGSRAVTSAYAYNVTGNRGSAGRWEGYSFFYH